MGKPILISKLESALQLNGYMIGNQSKMAYAPTAMEVGVYTQTAPQSVTPPNLFRGAANILLVNNTYPSTVICIYLFNFQYMAKF